MIKPSRKIFACVSDVTLKATLLRISDELETEVEFVALESLFDTFGLTSAEALVLEFTDFGSPASQVVDSCRRNAKDIPVIAVVAGASAEEAGRLSRFGVFDFLEIDSTDDRVFNVLKLAQAHSARIQAAHAAPCSEPWRRHLVGRSLPMEQVTKVIQLVAARRCTVLITGETGTGKEMTARAIHMASDRAKRAMVAINCSAIPENLIEAELFGHVKGAFTGAVNSRMGRFEQANGGTLFLDEIGDLPLDLQAKLLRVLQEREIQRLGSGETIKIDVRVIAATNADLLTRVQQGRFREDLYYRLNVVPIQMPSLRQRTSDMGLLVSHFMQKVCQAEGLPLKEVSEEAIALLSAYSWPGNVRQLENVVEHAVIMSAERERLFPSDFVIPTSAPRDGAPGPVAVMSPNTVPEDGMDYTAALKNFERAILHQALSKAQGNKTLAADMLRLPRTTLLHKLRMLDHVAA